MIKFNKLSKDMPYLLFKEKYDQALYLNQKNIEALSISSYNKDKNEVDSRFVNLKFINGNKFIFFTNYNSPKSLAFSSHNQIVGLFFWPSINLQIRIKAKIKKTSLDFNQNYFKKRSFEKNALAISSKQSKIIKSYSQVKSNFIKSLKNDDLEKCPEYWGGYEFTPYYFEFWKGHESRINNRDVFNKIDGIWNHSYLQP